MLCRVIDEFTERMLKAIEARDFEELSLLDAACLRFMSSNLPTQEQDSEALAAIHASLERLRETYRSAVKNCVAAQEGLQQELQSAGRGRRNANQYLDVASNIGSL